LAVFVSDIEDRVQRHVNTNTKNKSLINKFLSDFEHQIDSNRQKKGLPAVENNVLEEKKFEFQRELVKMNEKNSQALDTLKQIIIELKGKTGLKHTDYDKVSEVVKSIIGDEFDKQRRSILDEMRQMLTSEKVLVMDNTCIKSLEGCKNDMSHFKDQVSKEISFLKSEISRLKSDTGTFYSSFKDKTDSLEQYLEEAANDLNRKYESIAPTKRQTLY